MNHRREESTLYHKSLNLRWCKSTQLLHFKQSSPFASAGGLASHIFVTVWISFTGGKNISLMSTRPSKELATQQNLFITIWINSYRLQKEFKNCFSHQKWFHCLEYLYFLKMKSKTTFVLGSKLRCNHTYRPLVRPAFHGGKHITGIDLM